MQVSLDSILAEAKKNAETIQTRSDFEAFKARLVGPKGSLTQLMKSMGRLPKEQRPIVGRQVNITKNDLDQIFNQILARVEEAEIRKRLGPPVDPTLPSPDPASGSMHPLEQVKRMITRLFHKIGFSVVDGSEVETEYFVFDALNTEEGHPARDTQSTYYLPEEVQVVNVTQQEKERYLLRTHTSSVQIRTLQQTSPPLRIISPGRCFRRDTADATHSASFHQIEGLYIDEEVTVKDLKAILDYFVKELLGKDAQIRFRPHFFPYTEPSFEVDFSSAHLRKIGKKWVEIMGCGMVDPTVFESVGYDPERWSGFAFGMGIERIAMILYGIDDIRYFYQNDLRFLRQFNRT